MELAWSLSAASKLQMPPRLDLEIFQKLRVNPVTSKLMWPNKVGISPGAAFLSSAKIPCRFADHELRTSLT